MKTLHLKSLESGAGKTAIALALMGAIKQRGYDIWYYKPISITNEIYIERNYTVPLYIKVIADYMGFRAYNTLCSLLFVPLSANLNKDVINDSDNYKVYIEGKFDTIINGTQVSEYIYIHRNIITNRYNRFKRVERLIMEDIGDYRYLGYLLEQVEMIEENLQEIYIVRPMDLDNKILDGKDCIITKSYESLVLPLDMNILGNIPYKTSMENLFERQTIENWIMYVSKYVDMAGFI